MKIGVANTLHQSTAIWYFIFLAFVGHARLILCYLPKYLNNQMNQFLPDWLMKLGQEQPIMLFFRFLVNGRLDVLSMLLKSVQNLPLLASAFPVNKDSICIKKNNRIVINNW